MNRTESQRICAFNDVRSDPLVQDLRFVLSSESIERLWVAELPHIVFAFKFHDSLETRESVLDILLQVEGSRIFEYSLYEVKVLLDHVEPIVKVLWVDSLL
jgi:hypothetical protein